MKKILLIGSQHGNEPLGDLLYAFIQEERPELLSDIDFIVGNPEAKKRNIRYVEADLNRSYTDGDTYEQHRAKEILTTIKDGAYQLVLDLHTTACNQPPCLITARTDHPFIRASSIEAVVHMNHAIVESSLIGVCENAISVEINKSAINIEILSDLCNDIQRFFVNKSSRVPKHIYEVVDLLNKTEISETDTKELRNFEKSKQGFYPILTGENSYKKQTDYLGFKAYERYEIKV